MTLWEWLEAMRRRGAVVAAGLLCTVAAVWVVHSSPVSYVSCGSVIVSAPSSPTNANHYNDPQPSLIATGGFITIQLQSPEVINQIRESGATATYQAQMHNTGTSETPQYSEPETDVCAYSVNAAMSLRTANAVITKFKNLLRAVEVDAHVPPAAFINCSVLAPLGALPEQGRPSQAYLGVGVFGLLATASVALWTDQFLRGRRKERRQAKAALRTPVSAPANP